MRGMNFLWIVAMSLLFTASIVSASDKGDPLRPGDRIQITVVNQQDLTKEVVVDPDGYISLPLIERIKLAGLTTHDAAAALQRALKEFIVQPRTSVDLIEPGKTRVFVLGEVKKQGMVMLDPGTRLMEAVGMAEYLETADLSRVSIRRKSQTISADLTLYLSGKDLTPNVPLEQDDSVIVPRYETSGSALVLGAVARPGPVPLRRGMTFREVIAASGGVTVEADTSRVTVRHEGGQQGVPIDYSRAMAGYPVADLTIAAGDTVYIPAVDSAHFAIQGGVNRPGQYPIIGRLTIEDATAVAGGLTRDAKTHEITVVHTVNGKSVSRSVDLEECRKGKAEPIVLQAGDVVVVPVKRAPVDILGAVTALAGVAWLLKR